MRQFRLIQKITTLGYKVSLSALLSFSILLNAQAGLITDPNAPVNYQAQIGSANGVPLVNIAAPSGAGVSHNQYQDFDVDQRGLIFNNSTKDGQSVLGGSVNANPQFKGKSANIILNEVTGATDSQLGGAMEVFGQKANVIVANPNGVTCDGCAFINTNKATLTTGVPVYNNGQLDFEVRTGTVTIGRDGLYGDEGNQRLNQIELVARRLEVEGEVVAIDHVCALVGNLTYHYSFDNLAGQGPQYTALPGGIATGEPLAIDASEYGAMRAGNIQVMSTDAGAGVKLHGYLGTDAGDLFVQSAGDLSIHNADADNIVLNAQGDLTQRWKVHAEKTIDIQAQNYTSLANAELTARNKINVTTGQSQHHEGEVSSDQVQLIAGANIDLKDIQVVARKNLQLTAGAQLNADKAEIDAQQARIDVTGQSTLVDSRLRTQEQLLLNTGGVVLDNKSGLYADESNIVITSTGLIDNNGEISAKTTAITATDLTNQDQALIRGNDSLKITASGQVNNAGSIASLNSTEIAAEGYQQSATGLTHGNDTLKLTTRAGGLTGAGELSSDDVELNSTGDINLNGHVKGETVSASAANISNTGKIDASTQLNVIASQNATLGGTIKAQQVDINVTNTLTTSGELSVYEELKNTVGNWVNSGTVAANQLDATTTGTAVSNNSGTISAQDLLSLTIEGDYSNSGGITSEGKTSITVDNLTNTAAGVIQIFEGDEEHGGLSITAQNNLDNQGAIISQRRLQLDSLNFTQGNTGLIHTDEKIDITQRGNFSNTGGKITAEEDISLTSVNQGAVSNTADGTIDSKANITFNDVGAFSNADSLVHAGNTLTINAQSIANVGTDSTSTILLGYDALVLDSEGSITNAGELLSKQQLTLSAAGNFNNNIGVVQAQNVNVTNAAHVSNNAVIRASESLTITSDSLTNRGNGRIFIATAAGVTAAELKLEQSGNIHNQGQIVSQGTLTATGANFTNDNSVVSSGDLTIDVSGTIRNNEDRVIHGEQNVILTAHTVTNDVGKIESGHGMTINAHNLDNISRQIDTEDFIDLVNVNASFDRDRKGKNKYYEHQFWATWDEGQRVFTKGAQIVSGGAMTLNNTGTVLNQSSLISAGGDLTFKGGAAINNLSEVTTLDRNSIRWAFRFKNSGFAYGWEPSLNKQNDTLFEIGLQENNSFTFQSGSLNGLNFTGDNYNQTVAGGGKIVGSLANISAANVIVQGPRSMTNTGVVSATNGRIDITASTVDTSDGVDARHDSVGGTAEDLANSFYNSGNDSTPTSVQNGFVDPAVVLLPPENPDPVIDLSAYFDPDSSTPSVFNLLTNPNASLDGSNASSTAVSLFNAVTPQAISSTGQNIQDVLAPGGQFYLDPLQEAAVLRQAALAQTGRLFFSRTWKSEQEQQEALFANAQEFLKNYDFKIGDAIDEATLAQLKAPMLWYQKKIINGKEQLVPFVYLPRVSLADMRADQAGTMVAQDIKVDIDGDFTNTGYVTASNNVDINAHDIINKEHENVAFDGGSGHVLIRQQGGGVIKGGNNVNLDAINDIITAGGAIEGGNDVTLNAGNDIFLGSAQNVFDSRIGGGDYIRHDRTVKNNVTRIKSGGNTQILATNNVTAKGANIESGGTAIIKAENGNINLLTVVDEDYHYALDKSKSSTGTKKSREETRESFTNKGVNLNAGGNLGLIAGNDINLLGAALAAEGKGIVKAGGNINLIAAVDTEKERTVTKKSNAAKFKNTDKGSIKQTAVASSINTGGDLSFEAGGDMNILGSNIGSQETIRIGSMNLAKAADGSPLMDANGNYVTESGKSVQNLNVGGVQLVNEEWNETQKGLKGPLKDIAKGLATMAAMGGFTNGIGVEMEFETGSSSSDRSKTITQQGSSVTGKNLIVNAKDTARFAGADINIEETAFINATDIEFDALEESQTISHSETSETVKGLGMKAEKDEVRVAGVQITKHTETTTTKDTTWKKGQLNAKNLTLNASNNIALISNDISVEEDMEAIAGNEMVVGGRKDTSETVHSEKTKTKTTSVGVKNAYVDAGYAIKAVEEARQSLRRAKNKLSEAKQKVAAGKLAAADLKYYEMNLAAASAGLVNATTAAAGAVASAAATTATAGFYASGKAELKTVTKTDETNSETWVGSNINVGGDATLKSKNKLDIIGADITVADALTLDSDKILITAGIEEETTSSKTREKTKSASYEAKGNGSLSLSAGYNNTDSGSYKKTHINSSIQAGSLNSRSKNLTVAGANLLADDIDIETETLDVRSLQDEERSSSKTRGGSVTMTFNGSATQPGMDMGGPSASVNQSDSKANKLWTNQQTTIIGNSSVKIKAKDTTLTGAMIASASQNDDGSYTDNGNLDFSTDTLTVNDLEDTDTAKTTGFNLSVSKGSTTIGGQNNGHDKAQLSKATLGGGTIRIGGEEQTSSELAALGINVDVNNAQEITKDMETGGLDATVTVDHRMLTEEGREKIVNDFKEAGKAVKDLSGAIKVTYIKAVNNVEAALTKMPDDLVEDFGKGMKADLKNLIKEGHDPDDIVAMMRDEEYQEFARNLLDLRELVAEQGESAFEGVVGEQATTSVDGRDGLIPNSDGSMTELKKGELAGRELLLKLGSASEYLNSLPPEGRELAERSIQLLAGGPVKALVQYGTEKTIEYAAGDSIEKVAEVMGKVNDKVSLGLIAAAHNGTYDGVDGYIGDSAKNKEEQFAQFKNKFDALSPEQQAANQEMFDNISNAINDPDRRAMQVELGQEVAGAGFAVKSILGLGGLAAAGALRGKGGDSEGLDLSAGDVKTVEVPKINRKEALNEAKDRAGIPRSQQPDRQWQVGSDKSKYNQKNYKVSDDKAAQGRYYEFTDANGNKRVVVEHTADNRRVNTKGEVQKHAHAGEPNTKLSTTDKQNFDFKENKYQKIIKDNDHHIDYIND